MNWFIRISKIIFSISLFITLSSCTGNSVDEALLKELLNKPSTVIVDVRNPDEFDEGHIDGSINIPLKNITTSTDTLDLYTDIILVCKSGRRSKKAFEELNGRDRKNYYDGGSWQQINTILKTNK